MRRLPRLRKRISFAEAPRTSRKNAVSSFARSCTSIVTTLVINATKRPFQKRDGLFPAWFVALGRLPVARPGGYSKRPDDAEAERVPTCDVGDGPDGWR